MGAANKKDIDIAEQAETAAETHTARHAFKVIYGPGELSMGSDANLRISERKRINLSEIGIGPEKPNLADLDFLGQGMESLLHQATDATKCFFYHV